MKLMRPGNVGDAGLHRRSLRVLDRPGRGLALNYHHRFGRGGRGGRHCVRHRGAHRRKPVVPFGLFRERNRLATFAAIFLAGGVMFSLTVSIGYTCRTSWATARCARASDSSFVIAMGIGLGISSQLCRGFRRGCWRSAAESCCGGHAVRLGVHASRRAYFPNLVLPIVVGGIGIGMVVVPLTLAAIAGSVSIRSPDIAVTLMLQSSADRWCWPSSRP